MNHLRTLEGKIAHYAESRPFYLYRTHGFMFVLGGVNEHSDFISVYGTFLYKRNVNKDLSNVEISSILNRNLSSMIPGGSPW